VSTDAAWRILKQSQQTWHGAFGDSALTELWRTRFDTPMKYTSLFLVMLLSCFVLGCSGQKEPPVVKKTLRLRLAAEPGNLNPILSTDVYASTVEGMIFNGLLRVSSNMEMVPDLAASFEASEDGKRYTFRLRKDVLWHDGRPFTAADVAFTMDVLLDPKTNTVRRSQYVIDGVPVRYSSPDPYTIVFELPKPFAPFLVALSMPILPKHLLKDVDINTATFNRRPVGTGPFTFETWQPGQFLMVQRNQNYYRTPAKLDQILFKVIPDTNTALIALEKDEIDALDISAKDLGRVKKMNTIDLHTYDQLQYVYMGLNQKNPLFKDKRVREAIVRAIDREALVRHILKKQGTVTYLPGAKASWAYPSSVNVIHAYDPTASRALLTEAGFIPNTKTGVREKWGRPLSFILMVPKGNLDRERSAEMIQRYLKAVGIDVSLQLTEFQSLTQTLKAKQDPKPYDAALLGWSLGLDPDAYTVWHSKEYPNGFNFVGYDNPKVDDLLSRGRTEMDRGKRAVIYHEMLQILAEDAPYVFLYSPKANIGVNKRITGLAAPSPLGIFLDIEDIDIRLVK
jgi:peptide/nickel transport system substrate-binding protein